MDPAGLHHRLATSGDRAALSTFACTSADPRLEPWIRGRALDDQLGPRATDYDFRLPVFPRDDGQLVAVTSHERNYDVVDGDGESIPASYLMLAAITDRFRDGKAPDGRPLISAVLEATFDDIRSRNRGALVSMMVRQGNPDGSRVVDRLGAIAVGQSGGDDVFVLSLEP